MTYSAARLLSAGCTLMLLAIMPPASAQVATTTTVTNEGAKSDSLLLTEVPELAAEWTSRCLNAGQDGEAECWASAAAAANRFTADLGGAMINDLKRLQAAWQERSRLLQERDALRKEKEANEAQMAEAQQRSSKVEPVSEAVQSTKFASKKQQTRSPKKKIIPAQKQDDSAKQEQEVKKQRLVRAPQRVGRGNFNKTWRRHYHALRPGEERGTMRSARRKPGCLFKPCKGAN
ncbi:MAG TPA: hypothetical protein VIB38_08505 [Aestuariivirgaceae bacterium]|jgi:hypothetical protein